MIEVVMRIDDVPDRLVRNRFLHASITASGALVVERALHQRDIVLELHRHAVMRAPGQIPNAVGYLLRVHFDGRGVRGPFSTLSGTGNTRYGLLASVLVIVKSSTGKPPCF